MLVFRILKHAIDYVKYGVFFSKIHIELVLDKLHLKTRKLQNGRIEMDEKKESSKILELIRPGSKVETLKRAIPNFKNSKAKMSLKKIGRSRNQKGQKSY